MTKRPVNTVQNSGDPKAHQNKIILIFESAPPERAHAGGVSATLSFSLSPLSLSLSSLFSLSRSLSLYDRNALHKKGQPGS